MLARVPHLRPMALLWLLLWPAPPAQAATAELQFAYLRGNGWQAEQVRVLLQVDRQHRPTLHLQAARLELPGGLGTVTNMALDCPRLVTGAGTYACRHARIRGQFSELGAQTLVTDFRYDQPHGTLELAVDGLRIAGAQAQLQVHAALPGWRIDASLHEADLPAVRAALAPWIQWPAGTWSGRATVAATLAGVGAQLLQLQARVRLANLGYASDDNLLAAERLEAELEFDYAPAAPATGGEASVMATLKAHRGQLYIDPVYLDVAAAPFTLTVTGRQRNNSTRLQAASLHFAQPGVLTASGRGELELGSGALLHQLQLQLEEVVVPRAWPLYVAPFLATTDFKNLSASGGLSGQINVTDGAISRLDLQLQALSVDEPEGALALQAVEGAVRWSTDDAALMAATEAPAPLDATSRLRFAGGRLYGLPFGASELQLLAGGRGLRLLAPVTIPVLDGGLRIDTFRLRHAGEPAMWLRLDAEVLPIDMAALCKVFGWPVFGGTLAGRIPKAALENGVLTLGGNLEARVFDGSVTVSRLHLQDPLGRFPQLQADLHLQALDLALLTNTFEFGHISGRLSGEVLDLQLFDWQPVAFDARLSTPLGDHGPRRITPQAVQNLSSLGGGSGITSALSGGFLRFFKEFRYRQLGIACRLQQDVCLMGGVAPAPGGYYLIQGAGFPRVNLIGSQGRVAWSKLLRQLQRLSEGAPMSVQ